MGHFLIAAALAATVTPTIRDVPSALPDATPAIWVVNDHDTVIYLFGTFHALDGKTDWFNDEVLTAFTASEELVLETIVPNLGAPAPSPAPFGRVPAFAPVAGSASFMSTTKMVMSAGQSRGMSTDKGADSILRNAAEGTGKPVSGLESFEFQLGMFSRLPPTRTVPAARGAPGVARERDQRGAVAAVLTQLQAAWNRGDIESFGPMLDDMRTKSPETYRMLFAERNARWAGWIAERLEQPGTVFVAVGAGHLVGRDSVQFHLGTRGVGSARIN